MTHRRHTPTPPPHAAPADRKPSASSYSRALRHRIPKPNRTMAPVRWYGGKGNLARKILPHLPPGKVYVEPYCGAASLFWHLDPPREVEVLNDLNGEIINLFRILQSRRHFNALAHRLTWTPYSRSEFCLALRGPHRSPVDRAWSFFVRHNQGFAGLAGTPGNWGRVFVSSRKMAQTASSWRGRLHSLEFWHDRLTRVQLDNRDALDVIRYWDSPDTVFYCDPPYVLNTRISRNVYDLEATNDHHTALVDTLLNLRGRAVLSGYDSGLYKPLLAAGWRRRRFSVVCTAASRGRTSPIRGPGSAKQHAARTECLWISPPHKQKG